VDEPLPPSVAVLDEPTSVPVSSAVPPPVAELSLLANVVLTSVPGKQ
jgi:hypothetical protein